MPTPCRGRQRSADLEGQAGADVVEVRRTVEFGAGVDGVLAEVAGRLPCAGNWPSDVPFGVSVRQTHGGAVGYGFVGAASAKRMAACCWHDGPWRLGQWASERLYAEEAVGVAGRQ